MALKWKVVSQRNWVKGLQATFNRFSQPQAIVTRLSNLLYDIRGGFRQTDGSGLITEYLGATDHEGPITEIALYSPSGVTPYYVGIKKGTGSGTNQIPPPVANPPTFLQVGGAIVNIVGNGQEATVTFTAPHKLSTSSEPNGQLIISGNSVSAFNRTILFSGIQILSPTSFLFNAPGVLSTGTGGTMTTALAAGIGAGTTYTYEVTASDGQGGETPILLPVTGSSGAPNNAVTISWAPVAGAVGYNVYGRIGGSIGQLNQAGAGYSGLITGTSFTDLGGVPFSNVPPTTNTTQTVSVYLMAAPTFSQVLGVFPSFFAPPIGIIPGASSPPTNAITGATPNGGILGATGPLPQIVQFTNKLIFALGNGFPPQYFLDQSAGGDFQLHPLPNNFNAQYTDWQPSVSWNQGDIIHDSVSGGLFSATNAGTSGTTRPAFVNNLNAQTPEGTPGTVVWKCIATSATGTALRGAAHAIVYAGSLWLANTNPTTTSDQLDGPCCIKMSDVNNANSWNPSNIAFLDRDDGDEITCLAKYTIAQVGIAPTGTLVAFKNFSTYQITGVFGAADFSIQNAQTDMGCIAGRSVMFIPGFGLMRLTHLGFAYFNGVGDKLTSEEVRPYLFGGPPDIAPIDWNFAYLSKGAQAANPPLYVCACPVVQPVLAGVVVTGAGGSFSLYVRVEQLINEIPVAVSAEIQVTYAATPGFTVTTPNQPGSTYRVFAGFVPGGENVYVEQATFTAQFIAISSMTPGFMSFGNGGLTRIFFYDLVMKSWGIVDLPFPISCLKQIRSPGTIPITVAGGASDGIVRRLFAGDQLWDNGQQVVWSFRASEIFQEGGSAKMFFRRLVLRGTNSLQSQITVTINLQGNDQVFGRGAGKTTLGGPANQPQWEMRIDIMRDAENANAQISGAGAVQIQIDSMDWHTYPKPSGTPVTIQR